jgi:hypothetical protein
MKRLCYFIPADGYIEGQGFRVSIIEEGESGHCPTGTWPYEGKPGQKMPWFWGDTYDGACEVAEAANLKNFGLTKEDVTAIALSSMRAGHVSPPKRRMMR